MTTEYKYKYKYKYASIDGPYRYWLERMWGDLTPWFTIVMLNPSTADGMDDDPTIRRCVSFAQREGYGNLHVFNLFAWRATDPKSLVIAEQEGNDIIGIGNPALLHDQLDSQFPVVVAWGANYLARPQAEWFAKEAALRGKELLCLGTTMDGSPKHPLYVKGNQPLVPWEYSS